MCRRNQVRTTAVVILVEKSSTVLVSSVIQAPYISAGQVKTRPRVEGTPTDAGTDRNTPEGMPRNLSHRPLGELDRHQDHRPWLQTQRASQEQG